jgi:hypothetical protein
LGSVYLYQQERNKTDMKKVDTIRIEAIRVINNVIVLKRNIFNGCSSDQKELDVEEKRLIAIKKWAVDNGQIQSLRQYFASKNFGDSKFQAFEVSTLFNN